MNAEFPIIVIDPSDAFYTGPERRQAHREWRANVDAEMKSLRADLDANTAVTQAIKDDTGELITTFQSFKGAMQVLEMLGKLARPLGYIVMFTTAVWGLFTLIKGGGEPPR
jgi:hypothetical protein